MLDLALLGLLSDEPLHGYELKKQLSDVAGTRAGVSFGALYPALNRLERAALVRTVTDHPEANHIPMTGSLGAEVAAARTRRPAPARAGRTRKVYAITPAGEERLAELLRVPATDERTFHLQIAFCRHLPADERLTLFERRRHDLLTQVAHERAPQAPTPGSDRRRDRYRRALRDRDTAATQAELTWLDHLIDDERRLAVDPVPPTDPVLTGSGHTPPSGGSQP